jgi:cytochrome P450
MQVTPSAAGLIRPECGAESPVSGPPAARRASGGTDWNDMFRRCGWMSGSGTAGGHPAEPGRGSGPGTREGGMGSSSGTAEATSTRHPVGGRASRLQLLESVAARDAAVVPLEIAGRPTVFVNDPDLIREVLVERAASFEKSEFQLRVMGSAEGSGTGLGRGMLVSPNATNRVQRRLLRQVFAPPAVRRHAGEMARLAREQRDRWPDGAVVELGSAFMSLSARIAAATLFSWDMALEDETVVTDLALVGNLLGRSAGHRRAGWTDPSVIERAAAGIEQRLLALLAERRRHGYRSEPATADVIDVLLAAQAAGAGPAVAERAGYLVTDEQIRDELMTLFITGAENPRNALTWTLYLLGRHPEAAARVRAEARAAGLEHGAVPPDALDRLTYTGQVFKESLRLYPPGYAFGRRAVGPVSLAALHLDPGTEVVISPYTLHRRGELFDRPHEFLPERFAPGAAADRHPFAYLPFGAGPRGCIGGGFAMVAGPVVLAVLLAGVRLIPASSAPVPPEPRMTLRPGGPVHATVRR